MASERVEPPAEHRGVRWHWLRSDAWTQPAMWIKPPGRPGYWLIDGADETPENVAWRRFVYLAPCIPPEPPRG